jgi:hypothetical protein
MADGPKAARMRERDRERTRSVFGQRRKKYKTNAAYRRRPLAVGRMETAICWSDRHIHEPGIAGWSGVWS